MNSAVNAVRHHNHFDFLRIVAAYMVLCSHQFPLTGRIEWVIPQYQSLGGIGLLIFFSISGFLVAESWQRDPHVIRFALRRMLRVWPGLAVAVALAACVLGPLMTTLPLGQYFANPITAHYFGILKFIDAEYLPGVFDSNSNHAVNGSLWTLPVEVRWYVILAILGLLQVLRWRVVLLLGTLVMAVHYFGIFDVQRVIAEGGKRGWKEELGIFFLAGACLHYFRAEWERNRFVVAIVITAIAVLLFSIGQKHAAFWLIIPFVTLNFGLASWPGIRRTARFGDFSYGVYIYAFPVQQTIIALTSNTLPFALGLAASALTTFAFAFLSWHCVEKQALKLKPSRSNFVIPWRRLRARDTARAEDGLFHIAVGANDEKHSPAGGR